MKTFAVTALLMFFSVSGALRAEAVPLVDSRTVAICQGPWIWAEIIHTGTSYSAIVRDNYDQTSLMQCRGGWRQYVCKGEWQIQKDEARFQFSFTSPFYSENVVVVGASVLRSQMWDPREATLKCSTK